MKKQATIRTEPADSAPRAAAPDRHAELDELRRLIRRGNDRWKRLVVIEALGLAVAAPLLYLWMIFALDSVLHLSMPVRFMASLVFAGAAVMQARRLRSSWRQARFSDDEVALAMERNTPGGLENRLINAVQLAASVSSAAPDAIREAVVRDNTRRLRLLHIEQAARLRPALIRIGLAAGAIIAGLVFHLARPEHFSTAAARILLPFSSVEPLYRTRLTIEPGDIRAEPGADVRITIHIEGRLPDHLLLISRSGGERRTLEIPVPGDSGSVEHVFRNLRAPLSYAVRGGDYTSPFFTIEIPEFPELQRLRVAYAFPEYTLLPERVQDGAGGDMQAVAGTVARLRFFLTRPAASAELLLTPLTAEADGDARDAVPERMALKREGPSEFSGRLTIERSLRYRLETRLGSQPPSIGRAYEIRASEDQPPDLHLAGLTDGDELTLDALAAVTVVARDDFGLLEAGVFSRLRGDAASDWEALETWNVRPASRAFDREWVLAVAATGAAEGDVIEIAARGRDTDPRRAGVWHTGQSYGLTIGAEGTRLQIEYERILRTEADLNRLIKELMEVSEALGRWLVQLNAGSGLRWDDQGNLRKLADGLAALAETQAGLRAQAAAAARDMPEAAGSLRISVGMLADSEMIRAIQMIEGAAGRDTPEQKRAVLGEARLTQERTVRSLRDVLGAYTIFRQDWELDNMSPFLQMLARRQTRMAGESLAYADLPRAAAGERLRTGTSRRQRRLKDLTGLAQTAFAGIAGRSDALGDEMARAFAAAAEAMNRDGLKAEMEQAAGRLLAGEWARAAAHQEQAATELGAIHDRLRQTQDEIARRMMEELRLLAEESPDAQAAIKQLDPGYSEQLMQGDLDVMAEIVKMAALAENMKGKRFETAPDGPPQAEGKLSDYISSHSGSGYKMSTAERDFSIMTLASRPGGQLELIPGFKTDEKMNISLIQDYQDVVGDLLEEADDVRDEYQSIVNMLQGQDVEGGDIGKGGHGMASVSAAAPTGNLKPDTHEHGGASRIGRQGARAHGIAVGDESISRRGRDEAQEGSEEVPDVAGAIRETLSDDPSEDHSTGIGGREVEGDRPSSFSVKDAGEWDDAMASRMKTPQSTYQLVERAGKPLAPEVAERLRAMDSTQQQLIERVKRVKKELDNLYLPTDHLDDALRNLAANLDRLRTQPDLEVFRLQLETLDRLIGAVMVFDRPVSEFQPSLARQSAMRGEILDETPGPALPEYEEAVKRYYERLANP